MAVNKTNGKVYIGKTVKSLDYRKVAHIRDATAGRGFSFQRALRKYGEDGFFWMILENIEVGNILDEREKWWIQFFKSFNPAYGYNLMLGGQGGQPTEETRQKLSSSLKGRKLSDEHKAKIAAAHKGKAHPISSRRPCSEETRQKISASLKGRRVGGHHKKSVQPKIRTAYNDLTKEFFLRGGI